MKLICMLLAISSLAAQQISTQQKSSTADPNENACPDTHAWTGKIENHSYNFAFVIPKHLEGFWNSAACVADDKGVCQACMSDHGRIIPLSSLPYDAERHIEVYAGHIMEEDADNVAQRITWIRERGRNLQVLRRSKLRLSGMKADRVVVRYLDNKQKQWMVEDFIESRSDRFDFSLYLRTPEVYYRADRPVFETVIASFALTPNKD